MGPSARPAVATQQLVSRWGRGMKPTASVPARPHPVAPPPSDTPAACPSLHCTRPEKNTRPVWRYSFIPTKSIGTTIRFFQRPPLH